MDAARRGNDKKVDIYEFPDDGEGPAQEGESGDNTLEQTYDEKMDTLIASSSPVVVCDRVYSIFNTDKNSVFAFRVLESDRPRFGEFIDWINQVSGSKLSSLSLLTIQQ